MLRVDFRWPVVAGVPYAHAVSKPVCNALPIRAKGHIEILVCAGGAPEGEQLLAAGEIPKLDGAVETLRNETPRIGTPGNVANRVRVAVQHGFLGPCGRLPDPDPRPDKLRDPFTIRTQIGTDCAVGP